MNYLLFHFFPFWFPVSDTVYPPDRRAGSSMSGYRKDDYSRRYDSEELPEDVIQASAALEKLGILLHLGEDEQKGITDRIMDEDQEFPVEGECQINEDEKDVNDKGMKLLQVQTASHDPFGTSWHSHDHFWSFGPLF
ncbi:hypothetical protein OIU84_029045 [Salix udensis]|uniref:Uncharacterized protein n=1 Tax=Salix udensis TaxID=889485 RepID=A0AAD6KFW3_9ROSI|nr:hypothetical protein OIU84_029045 [Salix udensis]